MLQRVMLVICLAVVGTGCIAAEAVDPPPGFIALFDGASLDGWQGGTTHDPRKVTAELQASWDAFVPSHWQVLEGELVNDGEEPHLVTKREVRDFELWVDWQLAPKGDSGIYLRGCPQVQLWDPTNEAAHRHGSDKGSGGLWNNMTHSKWPSSLADKPIGQWNRMFVRMVGEYVTVILNDVKVVDNVVLENYFDRSIPVFASGPLHLQTHGSETRFRNIFLRELPAEETVEHLVAIRGGEEGFMPLLQGSDFAGWTGAVDSYELADGVLTCREGRRGNLVTEREYANFVVRLEFKLPPGGNNGLAIRTPSPEADAAFDGIEVQILDDDAPKYADIKDYQSHGSAYGLAPAHRGYLRPAGQWNYQELVVDGDHIEVHLNGVRILDADLAEARQAPRDGKNHPGAARTSGHFGFAGHNDPVSFRNVRIKELP